MFYSKKNSYLNAGGHLLRTGVFLVLFLLVSSASFADKQKKQDSAPHVSLNMKNKTINEVVSEIEKQSGYSFFYEDAYFDKKRRVLLPFNEVVNPEKMPLTSGSGEYLRFRE